uniref:SAM domain-containing protein n=1 Tax=Chaetoceros debilis TaxID=122233 RepID=A0A6S8T5V4_9STRA
MADYVLDSYANKSLASEIDTSHEWSPKQLSEYLTRQGLGEYSECIVKHKISGKLAPLLSELDLKEMGITCIGDRLRFRLLVENLKRRARSHNRTRCIWEGEERVFYSAGMEIICTCFGCCPTDPSTYKLMSNFIKIKTVRPLRIGRLRLCCCNQYTVNNVDLTNVADVDVNGVPAPCCERILCCAPGKDIVDIEIRGYGGGDLMNHKLILREAEGDRVAELVMNSVEESQRIERE